VLNSELLTSTLPTFVRLALAYAPGANRDAWLAYFALDARLASLVRSASEPMLAQLRIAWWREALEADQSTWPKGDPILNALATWNGNHRGLASLADGWEAITAPAPLEATAMARFAKGRADSIAVLAEHLGASAHADAARQLATEWSLADLAMRLSREDERGTARALAQGSTSRTPRAPRALRPIAVLRALSWRQLERGGEGSESSPLALLGAMRAGLLGR
jgi:15-cis-phytoene synthase